MDAILTLELALKGLPLKNYPLFYRRFPKPLVIHSLIGKSAFSEKFIGALHFR